MKIGFISDAHGNPRALRNCLRELERRDVDSVYFLGDAVGYLPGENEVLEILHSWAVDCQKGNHEAMLLGEMPLPEDKDRTYRIHAARKRITRRNLEFIRDWPNSRQISMEDRKLLLVHGSPEDPLNGYVYSPEDLQFESVKAYGAIFMAHTHRPFAGDLRGVKVINIGSCGLPRDQGDLSSFALYDSINHDAMILRLPFDARGTIESFGEEQLAPEVVECLQRRSPKTFGVMAGEDSP